jgi:hypothetical protein
MEGLQPRSDGYVVDALEFAAALTDEDLMPVAVWIGGSNCATIEDIDPSDVECRGPITQWWMKMSSRHTQPVVHAMLVQFER